MIAHVRMRIFSGWPNPEWTVDDKIARRLVSLYSSLPQMPGELPEPQPRLGYRGFVVTFLNERSQMSVEVYAQWAADLREEKKRVLLDKGRQFEKLIYQTAPAPAVEAVQGMSFAQLISQGKEVTIAGLNPPDAPKINCANAPSLPSAKDWTTHRDYNNCYNYANDVLNIDEFSMAALPGTMTAMPSSTVTSTVKAVLRTQILKDDVTRVAGDKVPSTCPAANRHYMAIVLRHHPGSTAVMDFHCFRLDQDGTWSHKDGTKLPRNTDDAGTSPAAGNVITDLTQAKFDGDPVLVGVYRAKKNNPKVK